MDRHSDEIGNEVDFIFKYLLHEYDDIEHLPVLVFSYINPTTGPHFILHILISMGNFSTEIDLTHHATIIECLRSENLIGELDDDHSLQE